MIRLHVSCCIGRESITTQATFYFGYAIRLGSITLFTLFSPVRQEERLSLSDTRSTCRALTTQQALESTAITHSAYIPRFLPDGYVALVVAKGNTVEVWRGTEEWWVEVERGRTAEFFTGLAINRTRGLATVSLCSGVLGYSGSDRRSGS
jgi:hypothetical protein